MSRFFSRSTRVGFLASVIGNHSRAQVGIGSHDLNRFEIDQHQSSPPGKLMIVIASLGVVALFISGYLGWIALNSSKVAGCGGGSIFDCNDVINSRWSRWLGVPVSFLAFGMYATLLASIAVGSMQRTSMRTRKVAWGSVVTIGLSAGLAAIWFTSLQFFVLKHLCTYCLAAHTCGLMIAALILWFQPLGGKTIGYLALVSLLGFGVLAGGQLSVKPVTYKVIEYDPPSENANEIETFEFTPADDPAFDSQEAKTTAIQSRPSQPARTMLTTNRWQAWLATFQPNQLIQSQVGIVTFQEDVVTTQPQTGFEQSAASLRTPGTTNTADIKPKERRFVSMSGGSLKLDVAQWPLAGKQDAKYIFVEMFDYTCDHCRRTHAAVIEAQRALNDDVAVIALPIPLNTKCNNAIAQTGPRMAEACEISCLAVAVWRVDPSKFKEFHNYLMTTPNVATYAEAFAKANELVNAEQLNAAVASNVPSQYIEQHVELYKKVGAGNVPKLLFPETSIVGEYTSPAALVDMIKNNAE